MGVDYARLYKAICTNAEKYRNNYRVYFDMCDCLMKWSQEDVNEPYKYANETLQRINNALQRRAKAKEYGEAEQYRQLKYALLKWSAQKSFDHYMQALEYDRSPKDRFYLPRREKLYPIVQLLQQLEDGELEELFLSQPPRTGKTTLVTMFITWVIGKHPEMSNLYVSFSDTLTASFYTGVLEIIRDPDTYHWGEIFAGNKLAGTNSKDETLDINRIKKYHSLTCRSLYGTLNGACDCVGYLVSDDLLSGIEEAMSPDRLQSAWNHVDNNMLTRAKQNAKILWIGTRWSIADPIGKRLDLLQGDIKFRRRKFAVHNIPALNEKDESNFEYKYGVGFDTKYYLMRRASFETNGDLASWFAQYQGEPIEREGTVFAPEDMLYYNGELPDREPDRIFTAVDPAFGGGDYTSAPIVCQYDKDFYVVDVVFSNAERGVTQPMLARKAKEWNIGAMQIEASKAIRPFAEGVQEEMEKVGYKLTIVTKPAPPNLAKSARILDKAGTIRSSFYFLDSNHRTKEYNLFMQNLFSYKLEGKTKHDDAPDSMAMVCDMAFRNFGSHVEVFRRPF